MRLSKIIQNCTGSPFESYSELLDAAQRQGKTVFRLDHCQPDIPTPEVYYTAAGAFVPRILEYAPTQGMPIMAEALQSHYRLHGVHLALEDFLVTAGASQALMLAMQCILDPSSEVLLPEPAHPNDRTAITACGGVIRPLFTTPEEDYCYAVREKLTPLIGENTRAILLSNPCNPTGTVLTRAQMEMLADVVIAHDLWLVADEAYRDFVYDAAPISFAQMQRLEQHLVVLDSASKRFFVSGARVGALISKNRDFMRAACKLCDAQRAAATMNQVATAELYLMDTDFSPLLDEFRRRRDICLGIMSRIPGVSYAAPMGAFYLMARLPVDDADRFQRWLLEDFDCDGKTLLLAPGSCFYSTSGAGRSEVRLSYALAPEPLTEALTCLEKALRQYPGATNR